MAQIIACPDDPQLQRLARGQAASAEVEAFAAHLEQCPACAERLDRVLHGDTVMEAMQAQATAAEAPGDPKATLLVEQMLRLRPSVPAAADTSLPTQSFGPAAPATPPSADHPFLAPPQAPDEIGRLGAYRILKLLGAGGMGLVFQAEDVQLKRKVALKVMRRNRSAGW